MPYQSKPYPVDAYVVTRKHLTDRRQHPMWATVYYSEVKNKVIRLPADVPIEIGLYIVRDKNTVLFLNKEDFDKRYQPIEDEFSKTGKETD